MLKRKVIKPRSKTGAEMLDAFEAKLTELGVDASTSLERSPKFCGEDDIEEIEGCGLNASDDFDSRWSDTRSNYMERYY